MPYLFVIPTFKGIGIIVRTACLSLIHQPVFVQRFTWNEYEPLTSLALNGDFRIACKVLAHIEHKDRILAQSLFYLIALHDFYGMRYLWTQITFRTFHHYDGFPSAFFRLTANFQACIIILTTINAVKGHRAFCPLPFFVTEDVFTHIVLINDIKEIK